jgi:hypothetical protein
MEEVKGVEPLQVEVIEKGNGNKFNKFNIAVGICVVLAIALIAVVWQSEANYGSLMVSNSIELNKSIDCQNSLTNAQNLQSTTQASLNACNAQLSSAQISLGDCQLQVLNLTVKTNITETNIT